MNSSNFIIKAVSAAVSFVLLSSLPGVVFSAEQDEEKKQPIEEVVVTGSRLQGSAQAVLEERKNQAFVADILGSDQISRTGDSDAASALRRVTGLTLVDDKFIYIRGLGERYSATLLDGMTVPSPDPTRSVLPLDMFPSNIIESLNVQKAYSPNLPAHFAGGNVDIRIKSIPSESFFNVEGELGINGDNFSNTPWYSGGGNDYLGQDDGTRALPSAFQSAFADQGISNLPNSESVALLSSLNRNFSSKSVKVDPNMAASLSYGDRFELSNDMVVGFIGAVSYKNKWQVSNERNVNNLARSGDKITINEFVDGDSTQHNVKLSGMFNIGIDINQNHHFELNNLFLRDTRDRLRDRLLESTNTINEPNESRRQLDVAYEEREMVSSQLKGKHNFEQWHNLGVDWYYAKSKAKRRAPGGLETFFRLDLINNQLVEQLANDVNTHYTFQYLDDDVTDYGGNVSMPFYFGEKMLELKAGADFIQKTRTAESIDIAVQTFAIPSQYLMGSDYSQILSNANLAQSDFTVRLDDQTSGGDKYKAAALNDAIYLMADIDFGNSWRLTAGARYENFRQLAVPFRPHSSLFDVGGQALANLPFKEDKLFPSFAVTYVIDSTKQWRFNYSQTVIRPDIRDISASFYVDPLTEFLVRGSTSLQSSAVENTDVRFEWYFESGENLSLALFRKSIDSPIEMIELPSATEGAPQLLTANAKDGVVQGIEAEFLKDLTFIDDQYSNIFISGNLTLSDSEVNICSTSTSGSACLFEEQLREALNTTESVTFGYY
ncbi:MAG: TonB-dependent receptor [Enterobacterales bacterium]|nr:TonB-dependent receptor [Enterobacterales bacterium]